jgi:AcrR family transcriptional regulator
MAKNVRRRLPAGDRREQIMDAAEDLFIARGFEQVTMGDIADRLGTSRPTVYSYFPSTTAILDVLFTRALERLWGRLEPLVAEKGRNHEARVIATAFKILVDDRAMLALLHSGGSSHFHRQRRDLLSTRLTPLLQPYLPPGHGPYDLALLVTTLEGMAFWAISEGIADVAPLAESVADFIERGLSGASDREDTTDQAQS